MYVVDAAGALESILDCPLTVEGAVPGHMPPHGAIKKTKHGPLADFVKDSDQYYRAVNDHLKSCKKCDPGAVAELLVGRRKDKVHVSRSHLDQLMRLERIAKDHPACQSFPHARVVKAIIGLGAVAVAEFCDRVPLDALLKSAWELEQFRGSRFSAHTYIELGKMVKTRRRLALALSLAAACRREGKMSFPRTDAELEKLTDIAEVMGS